MQNQSNRTQRGNEANSEDEADELARSTEKYLSFPKDERQRSLSRAGNLQCCQVFGDYIDFTAYTMSFLSVRSVLASVAGETQTLITGEIASNSARSLGELLTDILDCGTPVCKWDELNIGRLIGHGTTMEVNEGLWNGRAVAIKRMKLDNQAQGPSSVEADDRQIRRHLKAASLELRAMSHSMLRSHPNVVDLLAVSWHEEGPEWHRVLRPVMITELAWKSEPTLENLMTRVSHKDLGLKSSLLTDILGGLDVLHLCTIVHGDLKPENVLIFKESPESDLLTAKLSDFGFSQADPDSDLSAGGTPYWNAPECLEGCPAALSSSKTKKSRDAYSFGLLAYYVICGRKPFGSDSQEEWAKKQDAVRNQKLNDHISTLLQEDFHEAVQLKAVAGRTVDFEIRIEDQDKLENSIRKVNCALAAGNLMYQTYDNSSEQWENADGWISIGVLLGLSFTARLDPSSRPEVGSVLNALGFARPETLQNEFIPSPGLPVIGWKSSANRSLEAGAEFDYNRVPVSMRSDLYKHIRIEASKGDASRVLKALIADWSLAGFGTDKNDQEASKWMIEAAQLPARPRARMSLCAGTLKLHYDFLHLPLSEEIERDFLLECLCYAESAEHFPTFKRVNEGIAKLRLFLTEHPMSMSTLRRLQVIPANALPVALQFEWHDVPKLTAALRPLEATGAVTEEVKAWDDQGLFELSRLATKTRAIRALKSLVQFKPQILEFRSSSGFTLLQLATSDEDMDGVASLSRLGADPATLFEPVFLRLVASYGTEMMIVVPLTVKIKAHQLGITHALKAAVDNDQPIASGGEISAVPALHAPIQTGRLRNLLTLMHCEPDLEVHLSSVFTPLWAAVALCQPVFVAALAVFGADANVVLAGDGYFLTPLHYICAAQIKDIVLIDKINGFRRRLETGADHPGFESTDHEPEISATLRLELCSALLGPGKADVNARDFRGRTPLMWCCALGLLEVAELLVSWRGVQDASAHKDAESERAVDFRATDNYGMNALHYAVWSGRSELVEFCVNHDSQLPTIETSLGKLPVEIARDNELSDMVKLLELGASPDTRNDAVVSRSHPA